MLNANANKGYLPVQDSVLDQRSLLNNSVKQEVDTVGRWKMGLAQLSLLKV